MSAMPKQFVSIQILRGFAALLVVIFHLKPFLWRANVDASILSGGVDIFFVISGFVMTISTRNKRNDVAGFVNSRLWRIVPMYWIATAALLAAWTVNGGPSVELAAVFKSLFFVAFYNPHEHLVQPLLGVGWTLNIEMVFYALFAATMTLRVGAQCCLLAAIFAFAAALRVILKPSESDILFFYTTPMLFEFLGGMILGIVADRLYRLPALVGLCLFVSGVAMAVGMWWAFNLPRTVDQGIPGLLIVASGIVLDSRILKFKLTGLKRFGDASYSLYLLHPVVIFAVAPLLATLAFSPVAAGLALCATSIACGVVAYLWIEMPISRLAHGAWRVHAAEAAKTAARIG